MGRKKTKASAKSQGQQQGQDLERVDSLKAAFLDLIGGSDTNILDPTHHDEYRVGLVETLRAFASQTTIDMDDFQTNVHDNDQDLVVSESIARRLRTDMSLFSKYSNIEQEEVFHIYRELQVSCIHALSLSELFHHVQHELIVLESVYRAYLMQIAQEESILDQLAMTLDALYTLPKNIEQLRLWIRQLTERYLVKDALRTFKFARWTSEEPKNTGGDLKVDETPNHCMIKPEFRDFIPPSIILDSTNAADAARQFLSVKTSPNASILVVGPPGSGKTHICNSIERQGRDRPGVKIIRPRIPVDFMGPRVGDPEHSLQSLFAAAADAKGSIDKLIFILDDAHFMLGSGDDSESLKYLGFRLDFLSHLDHMNHGYRYNTLIICTSSTNLDDELGRFTKTFTLKPSSREERISMIKSCLEIMDVSQGTERAIDTLSTCLLGRSRAEIA